MKANPEIVVNVNMSLRDYFAAHASDEDINDIIETNRLIGCFKITRQDARFFHADAMLKARGQENE